MYVVYTVQRKGMGLERQREVVQFEEEEGLGGRPDCLFFWGHDRLRGETGTWVIGAYSQGSFIISIKIQTRAG